MILGRNKMKNKINILKKLDWFLVCIIVFSFVIPSSAVEIKGNELSGSISELRILDMMTESNRSFTRESDHRDSSNSSLYQMLGRFSCPGYIASFGDLNNNNLSEMYIEDYDIWGSGCIMGYEFNSKSIVQTGPIINEYGLPWCLEDINNDGYQDFITQTGDSGLSGNGYLDIYYGPSFDDKQRFTFPGMKTVMYPRVYDIDGNGWKDILFTPSYHIGEGGYVIWAEYDEGIGKVKIIQQMYFYQNEPCGGIAIADFDEDGRIEFVIGSMEKFYLFEVNGKEFRYIGTIATNKEHGYYAKEVDFSGNGNYQLMIGYSRAYPNYGFYYELYSSTNDNLFNYEGMIHIYGPYGTCSYIGSADTDNDGKEEIFLNLCPYGVLVEETEQGLRSTYHFHQINTGTVMAYYSYDINRDGQLDWIITTMGGPLSDYTCYIGTYVPQDDKIHMSRYTDLDIRYDHLTKSQDNFFNTISLGRMKTHDGGMTWTYSSVI